jgi:transposase
LVSKLPFDISVICQVLGLNYGKFYRWIKHHILDFKEEQTQIKLHEHDIVKPGLNREKRVLVPILKPENIGESMAIDEKHIGGQFYTVLTNAKTSKVAMLCSSIQISDLNHSLSKFGDKLSSIRYITRDLSPTFKKVATLNFPNAEHIADKFHVIRHAIDTVQSVRIRLKQEVLKQQREEQKEHDKHYKELKNKSFIGPKMKLSKKYKPEKLSNGETKAEILTRSRYICSISQDNWNEYQRKRASLLFETFPELQDVYNKILEFRNWYKAKPKQYEPFMNERNLWNWIYEVENSQINELANFANLVINHENEILNYHKMGNKTNAIAESINAKINNANMKNNGARDTDFFNYRLQLIL